MKYGRFIIGTVEGQTPQYILPTVGALSPVPFAEPQWLTEGFKSPYYNDTHRGLQKYMRDFTDEFVTPEAQVHEKTGERPTPALIQKMGAAGINHMRMGPSYLLKGMTLPGGLKGDNYDFFHELIITQELIRAGARGYADGLQGGMVIGVSSNYLVCTFESDKLTFIFSRFRTFFVFFVISFIFTHSYHP